MGQAQKSEPRPGANVCKSDFSSDLEALFRALMLVTLVLVPITPQGRLKSEGKILFSPTLSIFC